MKIKNKEEKIVDLLGYEGLKIVQREDILNFSIDSTILAHFVSINPKVKRIIDLGCGNGYIPIFLTLRTKAQIYGVEIQPEVVDLAKKSITLNHLDDQIHIINGDIKSIHNLFGPSSFDVVVSNPPYFKFKESSITNLSNYQTIARHEVLIKLDDIVKSANVLLKDGGTFAIVHRSDRLLELFDTLKKYHFNPQRMQFVFNSISSEESVLVVIESKKSTKQGGLKIIQPLYIKNYNNEYTDDILKIFNFKKETK